MIGIRILLKSHSKSNSYIKVWDLRKLTTDDKSKKKKKKLKVGTENPCLMLRIDKTLAFQNKILDVTNKIIEFRNNEKKTKDDIKGLWYFILKFA